MINSCKSTNRVTEILMSSIWRLISIKVDFVPEECDCLINKPAQYIAVTKTVWDRRRPWQWRHNERDGASSHEPHQCLLDRLFCSRSKKTLNLRVSGLVAGISPVTVEFPARMTSYAEKVSIWWRHHVAGHHITVCTSLCQIFNIVLIWIPHNSTIPF